MCLYTRCVAFRQFWLTVRSLSIAVRIFIGEQGTVPKDGMNFNSKWVGSELTRQAALYAVRAFSRCVLATTGYWPIILAGSQFASFSWTRRFLLIEFRDYPSSFSLNMAVSAFIQDAWLHCHTCRHGSTRAGFLLCERRSLKAIAVSIFISEQGAVYFFQSVQIKGGGDLLLSAPFSRCRFIRALRGGYPVPQIMLAASLLIKLTQSTCQRWHFYVRSILK